MRSRSYLIEADVHIAEACEGVLIAHGDATTGYGILIKWRQYHFGRLVRR